MSKTADLIPVQKHCAPFKYKPFAWNLNMKSQRMATAISSTASLPKEAHRIPVCRYLVLTPPTFKNQHTRELISAQKTSQTKTRVAYGNSHLACM